MTKEKVLWWIMKIAFHSAENTVVQFTDECIDSYYHHIRKSVVSSLALLVYVGVFYCVDTTENWTYRIWKQDIDITGDKSREPRGCKRSKLHTAEATWNWSWLPLCSYLKAAWWHNCSALSEEIEQGHLFKQWQGNT